MHKELTSVQTFAWQHAVKFSSGLFNDEIWYIMQWTIQANPGNSIYVIIIWDGSELLEGKMKIAGCVTLVYVHELNRKATTMTFDKIVHVGRGEQ